MGSLTDMQNCPNLISQGAVPTGFPPLAPKPRTGHRSLPPASSPLGPMPFVRIARGTGLRCHRALFLPGTSPCFLDLSSSSHIGQICVSSLVQKPGTHGNYTEAYSFRPVAQWKSASPADSRGTYRTLSACYLYGEMTASHNVQAVSSRVSRRQIQH